MLLDFGTQEGNSSVPTADTFMKGLLRIFGLEVRICMAESLKVLQFKVRTV